MEDDSRAWLRAVRAGLLKELAAFGGEWRDDGERVVGPGATAVVAAMNHSEERGHVDLGFVLNRERADGPILWDCVSGGSQGSFDEAATLACTIWGQTTAPTVFELLGQQGKFADHSRGDERLGLREWHSIHGPILAYGPQGGKPLQKWCIENPIVPSLAELLRAELPAGTIHGVKFLLGAFGDQSIAEVRIDGTWSERCSEALLRLPWPKTPTQVARFYVVFAHAEAR